MIDSWQRVLWVSWIAQILAIVGFSFVYPFLPLYVQHLGVHDQHAVLIWSGAMFAGTTVAMAICAPIWGALSDRYGRKPMVVRAMASGAVLIFLMTLVRNPEELLVLRILQGVFTGSVAASQALVSTTVPRERLGFSMGLMQTALFAGSSIGPLIGGQLDDHFGFETTFVVATIMLILATLMVILMVEERFTPISRSGGAPYGFWASAGSILANRQMALLILVLCAVQFGGQVVSPILPVFVEDLGGNAHNAASLAGNVFAVAGLGSAITAVLAGRLTDRSGHFKLVLLLATILTALLYIPQHSVTSINQLYLLRGLVGLTIGAMLAVASAMITLGTPREQRGTVIGLSAGVNAAGQAVGQIGGSAMASGFGVRSVFLVTAFVMALVSVAEALWLREPVRGVGGDEIVAGPVATIAIAPRVQD